MSTVTRMNREARARNLNPDPQLGPVLTSDVDRINVFDLSQDQRDIIENNKDASFREKIVALRVEELKAKYITGEYLKRICKVHPADYYLDEMIIAYNALIKMQLEYPHATGINITYELFAELTGTNKRRLETAIPKLNQVGVIYANPVGKTLTFSLHETETPKERTARQAKNLPLIRTTVTITK